jgi:hypothetical protein
MMMGYAGMGMGAAWIFGAIAVALIWGAVWWTVTAIGVSQPRRTEATPPATRSLPGPTWEQPPFPLDDAAALDTATAPALPEGELR